jgi:Ca2+-binding EF-hand superfamily protein
MSQEMSEEQKERIIEAVQMAKDGFITRNEMVAKIKDAAEIEAFEEVIA